LTILWLTFSSRFAACPDGKLRLNVFGRTISVSFPFTYTLYLQCPFFKGPPPQPVTPSRSALPNVLWPLDNQMDSPRLFQLPFARPLGPGSWDQPQPGALKFGFPLQPFREVFGDVVTLNDSFHAFFRFPYKFHFRTSAYASFRAESWASSRGSSSSSFFLRLLSLGFIISIFSVNLRGSCPFRQPFLRLPNLSPESQFLGIL